MALEEIVQSFESLADEMESDVPFDLEAALQALKDNELELVTQTGEQQINYCVNLKRIVECCQVVHVEASIRQ